jgi:hypothetical protein
MSGIGFSRLIGPVQYELCLIGAGQHELCSFIPGNNLAYSRYILSPDGRVDGPSRSDDDLGCGCGCGGRNLSAASRRLGAPLPTVSRKISELEAHLNTRLLIRSTRRLTLTDAGAAYLAAVKRILDEVDAAERAASGEGPGSRLPV